MPGYFKANPDQSHQTVFHDFQFNSALPESQKTPLRMRTVGMQFVSAGTDTVSHTLHTMTWHIFNNPSILNKLRTELKTVQPDPFETAPPIKLESLPYLTGCIHEGLRFGFGVSNRSARAAPDRVLQFNDWQIPPGTPVSMTSVLMHLDERVWPEPEKFDPERWIKPEDFRRLRQVHGCFFQGHEKLSRYQVRILSSLCL